MSPELDLQAEQIFIENLKAVPQFKELVDFASDVCLNAPGRVREYYQHNRAMNSGVEPQLSVWATRAAFEVADDVNRQGRVDPFNPSIHITFAELAENPMLTGPPPIKEVLELANAFGEALLDEAFDCLGPEAKQKVEDWHNNPDIHNKVDILNWLERCVRDIRDKKDQPIDEEINITADELEQIIVRVSDEITTIDRETLENLPVVTIEELMQESPEPYTEHNHPVRLSPKIMGTYPNTATVPTCLGVSILMASFMRKLGVPYLHAGVMRSTGNEAKRALSATGEELLVYANNEGIGLPERTKSNIIENTDNYYNNRDRDHGYHAAVITKIEEDRWVYMDPNFDNSLTYNLDMSEKINDFLKDLEAASHKLGGTDLTLRDSISEVPLLYHDILYDTAKNKNLSQEDASYLLDSIITHPNPIALIQDYVKSVLLTGDEENDTFKNLIEYHFETIYVQSAEYDDEERDNAALAMKWLNKVIEDSVEQYLFPDAKNGDYKKSFARVENDARYRQNRIDDLRVLPQMVVLRFLSGLTNDLLTSKIRYGHPYLEVGLPATRIGLCVLSDFASICGDDLPAGFWSSHWSSGIALKAHNIPNIANDAQYQTARNIARILETSWLTYAQDGGKIVEFLEQGANYNPRG